MSNEQEQVFTFRVTMQGANAIITALGQMNTNTGVWPLMQGIIQQIQSQLPPPEENTAESQE